MSLGARRTLVAVILSVVVLAVIGLLYLQAFAQGRATRSAWMLTQDVQAGATLDDSNVKQVRIPAGGDPFAILDQTPVNKHAARNLAAQTLLRPDDILGEEVAQVPITLRANPPLARGEVIDVFALYQGQTLRVGKRLVVISPASPVVVEVPAASEQAWAALQAASTPLYATTSPGVSVGDQGPTSQDDAIRQLTGSSGGPAPTPIPTPKPSPTR
jgi:SAF domain